MAELRVNPTRMEMKRYQTRYQTARRGHKLLKDKRDELMKKFLEIVRENKEIRERVEASLARVHGSFSIAGATVSPYMLKEALVLPKKEGKLDVGYRNVMSVTVPTFSLQVLSEGGSDGYNYGMAFTSGELDVAARELNDLLEDLVKLAELEKTAQMLAEEIEKTRRRVNALEYIMMPRYLETIKSIKMKLEENERGNTTRLMKVKDMMLAEQLRQAQMEQARESDEA